MRIVVHPQSIAHGFVIFTDGSVKAQLAAPDMRLPIGYALAYPDRLPEARGRGGAGVLHGAGRRNRDQRPPLRFRTAGPGAVSVRRAGVPGAGRGRHAAGRALGCKRSRRRSVCRRGDRLRGDCRDHRVRRWSGSEAGSSTLDGVRAADRQARETARALMRTHRKANVSSNHRLRRRHRRKGRSPFS